MKIKKRDSAVILESLTAGVVPSRGLQHIMVGRAKEAEQILNELQSVKAGSSIVKFFIGDYGSGKSFMQGVVKQVSLQYNFVVTHADFTKDKRLSGEGRALPLYTQLVNNLSTLETPEGNALSVILDKWITKIQIKVKEDKGYKGIDFFNPNFVRDVSDRIVTEVTKMDSLAGGYDFSRILNIYFKGFIDEDVAIQRKVLRWIRGEYGTKTEARKELGIRDIIGDKNYYDYLKVLNQFVKQVGYAGLVVNLDEGVNLYKIDHRQARERNYDAILEIFNDCLQSSVAGLYFTFSGTSKFLKDERRGLYSYGALRRRLEVNRYETEQYRDLTQPVIELSPLRQEELFVLLTRIRDIHAVYHDYKTNVSGDEIKMFINGEFALPGSEQFTKVGHIVKWFLDALDIMHANPDFDRESIFRNHGEDESVRKPDIMNRFSRT